MRFLVINGPNLNLLGRRNPEIYGARTLESINKYIKDYFKRSKIDFIQSNDEGEIIDKIQQAHKEEYQGIVINAGALSHYSNSIRDAIEASEMPVVEVHISNIARRETFRHQSVIAPVCWGSISGFGHYSYVLALRALAHRFSGKETR